MEWVLVRWLIPGGSSTVRSAVCLHGNRIRNNSLLHSSHIMGCARKLGATFNIATAPVSVPTRGGEPRLSCAYFNFVSIDIIEMSPSFRSQIVHLSLLRFVNSLSFAHGK